MMGIILIAMVRKAILRATIRASIGIVVTKAWYVVSKAFVAESTGLVVIKSTGLIAKANWSIPQ